MKKCNKCDRKQPLDNFAVNPKRSDGHNSQCKDCKNAYNKLWYQKNKKKHKLQCDVNKKKHLKEAKAYIKKVKDVPCLDCEKRFPHYVMDFDHIGDDKEFEISKGLTYSLKRIKEEIDKCEIVCSNCHRIRTYQRRQHAPVSPRVSTP